MSNLAIVIISSGCFHGGFKVDLRIRKGTNDYDYHYTVPAAPEIPELYEEFVTSYHQLGGEFNFSPITMPPAQITNCSLVENCQTAAERLQDSFIVWLAQFGWQEIRLKIENTFKSDEFFRVIFHFDNIQNSTQIGNVQADSVYLKKLPWHLWDLFENRENTYFALSLQDTPGNPPLKYPVRILAVFGGSDEGLKLKEDKQLLNSLKSKGAEVTQITKPTKEELSNQLWNHKWDVLFFAGHSSSHPGLKSGELAISDTERLSLRDLKQSLRKAVKKGLKLAIFNSCDGLGLATVLDNVKVPQIIVMRELVPDEVARKFLQYFLESFTTGKSLYSAVREGCERLEALESRYPCASWLPVIYQNRNAEPLQWSKRTYIFAWLFSFKEFIASIPHRKKLFFALIALSLTVFASILLLQPPKTTVAPPPKVTIAKSTPIPNIKPSQVPVQMSLSSYGQKFFTSLNSNNNTRESGAKAFEEAVTSLKNDKNSAIVKLDNAINSFWTSLSQNKNDPEARIYLNNAISYYPKEEYSIKFKLLAKKLDIEENQCTLPQSQNDPLKIAVVIPVSFVAAAKPDIALEMLRGVAQVQNEVNCKGGIKGRMLQVAVFGDGSKDDLATKVAQEIVQQDFLAVVGHSTSNTTAKAGSVYDENKIVAISPISTAVRDSVKNPGTYFLGKYIFRTSANDMVAIDTLFDYWKNNVNQKFAIAYSNNSDYSKLYRSDFINKDKSLYFNDNMKCIFNSSTFDQTDCLNAIRGQAGALLVVPGSNDSPKALDLLKALNDNDKIQVLGGDTMYSSDTLDLKEKSKNLVIAVHWLRNRQQPTEFEQKAKTFWGNAPINWRTATTYDATQVITTALDISQQLQNSKENIRQDLQRIISASDFSAQGAFNDNIRFEEGDRKIDANSKFGVIGKVEKIGANKDGQDQYDFKPI